MLHWLNDVDPQDEKLACFGLPVWVMLIMNPPYYMYMIKTYVTQVDLEFDYEC